MDTIIFNARSLTLSQDAETQRKANNLLALDTVRF